MAFTTTDLANVEAAILALATGERVVSVNVNGQSVTYGQAQISDLRELRGEIKKEVSTPNRCFLISTSKGL